MTDLPSLTPRGYAKARARAARDGAPPELLADITELGDMAARLEAIAAEAASDPAADDDYLARARQRVTDRITLSTRQGEIMTRVTSNPAFVPIWRRASRQDDDT